MKYLIDYSNKKHEELQLVDSKGSINTWRVYFDEEVKTSTYIGENNKEEKIETYKAKFIETDKLNTDEVSAASLMREAKISDIVSYDSSSEVNCFYLNETPLWLDKETRVGVMNSTKIQKSLGQTTSTFWIGTFSISVPCDKAIEFLSTLEIYAIDCFNRTAEHKKAVESMTDVDEIYNYNFKTGYPEKLNLKI